MKRVLVTCPPMLGMRETFEPYMHTFRMEPVVPEFVQVMSEEALLEVLPGVDGWIIGDDQASRAVVEAGASGRLKAAVRWGIGVDNVDFDAFADHGIPVKNTPGMFGREVADVAVGYVVALARHTFTIDREVRNGKWIKPIGTSLANCTAGVVGYGDIGSNVCKRLRAADMDLIVWDPAIATLDEPGVRLACWPDGIGEVDFLVLTCALTAANRHMLAAPELARCRAGIRVVNVARGGLIDEVALAEALTMGQVGGVALDVFETEPLPRNSLFVDDERAILGSHNSSNTLQAVEATNRRAIDIMAEFLSASTAE